MQPMGFWSIFLKTFWDTRQLWLYLLAFGAIVLTVQALLNWISRAWRVRRIRSGDLARLTGEEFELFLEELFRKGGYEVERTPRTADYGVDLILTHPQTRLRIAVQAKRHNKPVGIHAVQEVYFGMAFRNCHRAVVVTNSVFTENAITGATAVGVRLIDGQTLSKVIDEINRASRQAA